jgi:hypothetical protein
VFRRIGNKVHIDVLDPHDDSRAGQMSALSTSEVSGE